MLNLAIFVLLVLLALCITCGVWECIPKKKQKKYFTDHAIEKMDTLINRYADFWLFILKWGKKAITTIYRWYKESKMPINQPSNIINDKEQEIQSIFESVFKSIIDSPNLICGQSYYLIDHCKLVFTALLDNVAMDTKGIESKVKNRVITMLKKRYPQLRIDFSLYVAIQYVEEVNQICIYIANNIDGLEVIKNVNNLASDDNERPFDIFGESWDEYGN